MKVLLYSYSGNLGGYHLQQEALGDSDILETASP
jgi:hypothetical protein